MTELLNNMNKSVKFTIIHFTFRFQDYYYVLQTRSSIGPTKHIQTEIAALDSKTMPASGAKEKV